jgi:hypothetical protein
LDKVLSQGFRKECFFDGEEDVASICNSAAVVAFSCIFNTVGTARRIINILVVSLEADFVGAFVIIAIPLLQAAELGIARN